MTCLITILTTLTAKSQGTLYVSNINEQTVGEDSVSSDKWITQSFLTGTNSAGYILNKVELLMSEPIGEPYGFEVYLYERKPGQINPGDKIGELYGIEPTDAGTYSFDAEGIYLEPFGNYYTVVTALSPNYEGSYMWCTTSNIKGGKDRWIIDDMNYISNDGNNWQGKRYTHQIAVYATPVPETRTMLLVGLGLIGIIACKKK